MVLTVLFGAPGAGKSTIGTRIARELDATHLSTGSMLREAIRKGTPAGRNAQAHLEHGELAPDGVMADMLAQVFEESPPRSRFILDGYPRNVHQAEQLEELARRFSSVVDCAISLDVSQEVVLERLGARRICPNCSANYHLRSLPPRKVGVCDVCGSTLVMRDDDRPDTIRKRLAVYEHLTAPLTEWYRKAGKLRRVDGSRSADEVAENVLGVLAEVDAALERRAGVLTN